MLAFLLQAGQKEKKLLFTFGSLSCKKEDKPVLPPLFKPDKKEKSRYPVLFADVPFGTFLKGVFRPARVTLRNVQ